jgi:tetratricopeptide (TPR) repeat protein
MLWPAAAVILLLALFMGGNQLLTRIEANSQFAKAEELMKDSLRIYFEDVRLSGNYNYTASGTLMGTRKTYKDRAESHLQNAIEHGATSQKVLELLAEIYIAKGEFAKADSVLQELRKTAGDLAPVLNNLGVSQFTQKHWQKASDYFHQARGADPGFLKALFNLALAESQLGDTTQAISHLQKYVELETDEVGRNAAQHIIHELQTSGDEMP